MELQDIYPSHSLHAEVLKSDLCPLHQSTSSRLGPPSFPPLHLPLPPDLHRPSAASSKSTREQSSPELPAQLNPQFFPAEKITEPLESQAEGNVLSQSQSPNSGNMPFVQYAVKGTETEQI